MEKGDMITMEMNEFRGINSGREVFYNLLSRTYRREVDEEYLEMLIVLMPYIENIASQCDNESLKNGGRALKEFVNNLTDSDTGKKKELLLDLARDFSYLFLIGVNSLPNSESVYLSPEKLVKQEPRDKVLKIYREIGYRIPEDFNEPEDHIAIEFEFMAVLCRLICKFIDDKDNEGILNYLNYQKNFLEEHLNKWTPQFCNFLIRAAEGRDFYRAIAYLTKGFLVTDYEFIREVSSDILGLVQSP